MYMFVCFEYNFDADEVPLPNFAAECTERDIDYVHHGVFYIFSHFPS